MKEVTIQDITQHLLKHWVEDTALECRVKELEHTVWVLWGELVNRTGEMNLKNDWYGLNKRLMIVEEDRDGLNVAMATTLKEVRTKKSGKPTHIHKYK